MLNSIINIENFSFCWNLNLFKKNKLRDCEEYGVKVIKELPGAIVDITTDFILIDEDFTLLSVQGCFKDYIKNDDKDIESGQYKLKEILEKDISALILLFIESANKNKKESVYLTLWHNKHEFVIHVIPIISNNKVIAYLISKTAYYGEINL